MYIERERHLSSCVRSTGDNLDALHDITVAYPQSAPQTERHLLAGTFPHQIHFHVRRYPVSCLPKEAAALQAWCQERWAEKEERLRSFYSSQRFDDADARIPPCKSEARVALIKAASLCYWNAFVAFSFLGLWLWTPVRVYFLVVLIFFLVQQKVMGGVELIELACHQRLNRTKDGPGRKTD